MKNNETIDLAAAGIALAFAVLVSLFAIRSNDIWWMLAVGRRLVETKRFITSDPFTFTAAGTPWAPQSYLAALLFYAVHEAVSVAGLIVLRAALVLGIFAVSLRTLRRLGVSWAIAAPVVLLVLLNAHSRFILRAHLFEYLFIVVLMGFLFTAHKRKGKSFYLLPVVVQIVWVNTHPSFLLGPVLVVLFFAAEWLGGRLSKRVSFVRPLYENAHDWRRVGILVLLMTVACFVNPMPGLFLTQPLGAEQRELMSRFTLEWRSPFDPALRQGAFHPYYEILLAVSALSIVVSITRLPLAPALMVAATAFLSLKAHRFRVEFALVSLPMIFVLFEASPLVRFVRKRLKRSGSRGELAVRVGAVAAAIVLAVTARDRVSIDMGVADRYPDNAFEFVRREDIAHRPFHTIGFGSYLLWNLYGERQSFIDGRNFSAEVHHDFLACQGRPDGPEVVSRKYGLDAFVLPPLETSDAGIKRIHHWLDNSDEWTLVFLDRLAWIYAKDDAVDAAWLARNAYARYNPVSLYSERFSGEQVQEMIADLGRAVAASPDYVQLWLDRSMLYGNIGDYEHALDDLHAARNLDGQNPVIWNRIGQVALAAGKHSEAIAAFTRLVRLAPDNPASTFGLGRVFAAVGDRPKALACFDDALRLNPAYLPAYEALFDLHARGGYWDDAIRVAQRMVNTFPNDYRGYYFLAVANAGLGRRAEVLKHAEASLDRNAQAGEVYVFLANLYLQEQNYAESLRNLESALTIDPDDKAALDLLEKLQSIQP